MRVVIVVGAVVTVSQLTIDSLMMCTYEVVRIVKHFVLHYDYRVLSVIVTAAMKREYNERFESD